jgi:hypothetical protein
VATDTLTASEVDLDRPAVDTVRVLVVVLRPGLSCAGSPTATVPGGLSASARADGDHDVALIVSDPERPGTPKSVFSDSS